MTSQTRKNKLSKTGIKGRGAFVKGWTKKSPGLHQRTVMLQKCGKKCFLGTNKSFPICNKNTCTINKKGIHAAYIRAAQRYSMTKSKKYKTISNKAYNMLY
jgi:hypothetical protein